MTQRIVTGAHYGLRDWLAQRISAAIMAVYMVIVVTGLLGSTPFSYQIWHGIFAHSWMRIATLLFVVSLAWHAWVGMRDILMDYVKPDGLRLALQILILLTTAAYVAWAVEILWR